MVSDRWQQIFGQAEFKQHKGAEALVMTGEGAAKRQFSLTFRNGTIEFDVDPVAMGAGLVFRMRDDDTFEGGVFQAAGELCIGAGTACKAHAVHTQGPVMDLFPQYQAPAPLRQDEWNHVKVVVSWTADERVRERGGVARRSVSAGSREMHPKRGLALLGPGRLRI